MLDLSLYAKPKQAIVPIHQRRFQYHHKSYSVSADDGWGLVEMTGNQARLVDESYDVPYKSVCGYTHNNLFVFANFDVAKRQGFAVSALVRFNTVDTFSPVRAVVWEDKRIYYTGINYSDVLVYEAKDLFDAQQPLAMKGVTPELRTVFLFHNLERARQLEEIKVLEELRASAVREEDRQRLLATLAGRLTAQFEMAGARLLGYNESGRRLIVDWELPGGGYKYNTVIDSQTWMCIETGICVSGDDARHNITSLVKTAEQYEDEGLTYLTRR